MSFSQDVKTELASAPPRKPCCRRALLYGLLCGAVCDGETLTATYSDAPTADLAVSLIKFAYGRQAEAEDIRRGAHKYTSVTFSSKNAVKKLELLAKTKDEGVLCECPECTSAFVRGAFMATGSINAPTAATHLELRIPSAERARGIIEILCTAGLTPLASQKEDQVRVYYKDRSAVQDFLSYLGCNKAVFDFINAQLQKDLYNNINRETNCVAQNINRSTVASGKHVQAIEAIRDCGLMSALPEKLRITAELRLANSAASFDELALLHTPPISKSGVSHRLEKIMDFYARHVQK